MNDKYSILVRPSGEYVLERHDEWGGVEKVRTAFSLDELLNYMALTTGQDVRIPLFVGAPS